MQGTVWVGPFSGVDTPLTLALAPLVPVLLPPPALALGVAPVLV